MKRARQVIFSECSTFERLILQAAETAQDIGYLRDQMPHEIAFAVMRKALSR